MRGMTSTYFAQGGVDGGGGAIRKTGDGGVEAAGADDFAGFISSGSDERQPFRDAGGSGSLQQ